jgi:hypothetical protein
MISGMYWNETRGMEHKDVSFERTDQWKESLAVLNPIPGVQNCSHPCTNRRGYANINDVAFLCSGLREGSHSSRSSTVGLSSFRLETSKFDACYRRFRRTPRVCPACQNRNHEVPVARNGTRDQHQRWVLCRDFVHKPVAIIAQLCSPITCKRN